MSMDNKKPDPEKIYDLSDLYDKIKKLNTEMSKKYSNIDIRYNQQPNTILPENKNTSEVFDIWEGSNEHLDSTTGRVGPAFAPTTDKEDYVRHRVRKQKVQKQKFNRRKGDKEISRLHDRTDPEFEEFKTLIKNFKY